MAQFGLHKHNFKTGTGATRIMRSVVVLGSPQNKCNGTGICMIMPTKVSTAEWKCPYLKADLFLVGERNLCFRFSKKSRHVGRVGHHFTHNLFQVPDAYRLPLHLQKDLGLDAPLAINPGVYPVVETSGYWMLCVPLVDAG